MFHCLGVPQGDSQNSCSMHYSVSFLRSLRKQVILGVMTPYLNMKRSHILEVLMELAYIFPVAYNIVDAVAPHISDCSNGLNCTIHGFLAVEFMYIPLKMYCFTHPNISTGVSPIKEYLDGGILSADQPDQCQCLAHVQ